MPRYSIDTERLTCTISLEPDELPGLDLRDGSGLEILGRLAWSLFTTANRSQDPDGRPWPPVTARTARRKRRLGPETRPTGVETGEMVHTFRWIPGRTEIQEREATWGYDWRDERERGKVQGFHLGGSGRPARALIGWPDLIQDQAEAILTAAQARKAG